MDVYVRIYTYVLYCTHIHIRMDVYVHGYRTPRNRAQKSVQAVTPVRYETELSNRGEHVGNWGVHGHL